MITKDNYQEFFLLYLDNELSAEDKGMVEEWVAANPDHQEEWESLMQCRIFPEEDTVFQDKKILMRSAAGIEADNYPEYFLSYIDGELSDKDRLMVESFIRQHPSKKLELEQLRQTVSTPDTSIVHPDKNSLYKNEEHRRIVILYRLLAGAAAVLLVAVTPLLLHRHPAAEPALTKNTPALPATANKTRTIKKDPSPVTPATAAALYPGKKTAKKALHPSPVQLPPPTVVKFGTGRQEPVALERTTIVPAPADQAGASAPAGAATGTTATSGSGTEAAVPSPTAKQVNIPRELSSFATQALLQEDNEKAIATASEPASPGKSKLRGLFRKVTRNFGKTADRDGEGKREVLINAFQVAVN